ncbi:unnamed protein product [Diatraea saccharalis]|uniref:Endoplasmic reticulum transmembrane protein n=1 Tax=Diatraea saccharalis TaxID=40085 RepID=A0A9N9R7I7_9NEOP|nr:unnamed protein product [Diatraea saccharalis]
MSFQWTFIAGYLYFETAVVIIMILPIFSPRRWHQFFKSRLFAFIQEHAAVYFYGLLGILSLFLIDAVREMRKYSHGSDTSHTHLGSELKGNVKLFRAQRNFYITGFAIFLAFVIRRLITMLIIQDELSLKAEKIIKEAEATVKLAKNTVLANTINDNDKDAIAKELQETKSLLEEEKLRANDFKKEAEKWRLKYEAVILVGKGDE